MTPIVFLALAATGLVGAVMVVLQRNPVVSALYLVLSFMSLAGMYVLLNAPFLAAVQVVVYAGAIMVLFVFVIMLLNLRHDIDDGLTHTARRVLGWIFALGLAAVFDLMLRRPWICIACCLEFRTRTESTEAAWNSHFIFPGPLPSQPR